MKRVARITLDEAAEALGKTRQAVSKQVRRHGLTPDKNGRYLAREVYSAASTGAELDKAAVALAKAEPGSLVERRLREQIRKLAADADTAEFRLTELKGDVVSLDDYRRDLMHMAESLRQCVRVWVSTTAAEFGDPEIKRRLVDAQRKAYAAILSSLPDGVSE